MPEELTDQSKMPFGKYEGLRMEDVPVSYLHWLWGNGMQKERSPVADYIRKNLNALKAENSDLLWGVGN